MTIIYDQSERRQALDPTRSFIVQAPAGSGKTELLIQRLLTLLSRVSRPEEVLAITFTKKAANEMRMRVIKALKSAAEDCEPEAEHAKHTWQLARAVLAADKKYYWEILNNPNQLRIQTIDSLCTYLTKQLPLLSHFGSQPDISENPDQLYKDAVREVLSHVEGNFSWSKSIAEVLLHLDNDLNKLTVLLVRLLAKRDQWLPYLHTDMNDKVFLEEQLAAAINDSMKSAISRFPPLLADEMAAIARFSGEHLKTSIVNISHLPSPSVSNLKPWQEIISLLLTQDGQWRKTWTIRQGFPAPSSSKNPDEKFIYTDFKRRIASLVNQLSEVKSLESSLREITYLPMPVYENNQWEVLQSLLLILKVSAAQLRVVFQQQGKIDFIENVQAAVLALGEHDNPTDLALALDYQIKHILVDEFQDTSFTQYHLLEKLTLGWETNDGRTLFVVGDPMQSIYRFREAEVGLFIRMQKIGIGGLHLNPITLSVSFRAAPEIVDWNNKHFQSIFPEASNIATGAVSFTPSISYHQANDNAIAILSGMLNADSQSQAREIAQAIQCNLERFPDDNIAILVRSRQHLHDIIPALKKAGIEYHAVETDLLANRQSILDLLTLTRALLHPFDRIAWLALLRAPWCGLTLADLQVIAGEMKGKSIWETMNDETIQSKLSTDGQLRLTRILSILTTQFSERERYPLRFWIESTWLLLGGPACLLNKADIADANTFFKLIDKMTSSRIDVTLESLQANLYGLYASSSTPHARVQIMTIHSAKGLEFDSVILPHLERAGKNDESPILAWMERPLENNHEALLLAPIHAAGSEPDTLYEYINRHQRIKLDYETDRLLYVATTRAKKRLQLFFNIAKDTEGEYIIPSGSFLKKLWPLWEKSAESMVIDKSSSIIAPLSTNIERPIYRLRINWENPITNAAISKTATNVEQQRFSFTDHSPKIIGIIVHRILQEVSLSGTEKWLSHDSVSHQRSIRLQLQQQGISQHALEASTHVCYQAIQNTIKDKRGQWILQAHDNADSEYAITTVSNDRVENFVIDRTFIDETGTRWIIDYKTAALNQTDVDAFLSKELDKYQQKLQKYARAMQLMDNKPIRIGLYFPSLPAWREIV